MEPSRHPGVQLRFQQTRHARMMRFRVPAEVSATLSGAALGLCPSYIVWPGVRCLRHIHRLRSLRTAHFYREQSMVRQNEQRSTPSAAKDDVDRTLRHIDPGDLPPRRVIHEDLSVSNVNIAFAIDGNALAAALRKGSKIPKCAVVAHDRAIGDIFRFAAHIDPLARKGARETISVQIVGEAPAGARVRRSLLEDAPRWEEETAVRRHVFPD